MYLHYADDVVYVALSSELRSSKSSSKARVLVRGGVFACCCGSVRSCDVRVTLHLNDFNDLMRHSTLTITLIGCLQY